MHNAAAAAAAHHQQQQQQQQQRVDQLQHRRRRLHVVSTAEAIFKVLMAELNWTEADLDEADTLLACPINAQHRVPPEALQKHIEACGQRALGAYEHVSQAPAYTHAPNVVQHSSQQQQKQHCGAHPAHIRAAQHASDARRAHLVRSQRSIRPLVPEAIVGVADDDEDDAKPARDRIRRRRQSYKGKGVNRTPVQQLRHLIDVRMRKLQRHWQTSAATNRSSSI